MYSHGFVTWQDSLLGKIHGLQAAAGCRYGKLNNEYHCGIMMAGRMARKVFQMATVKVAFFFV